MTDHSSDVSTRLVGDTLCIQTVHGTYKTMRQICNAGRTWGSTLLKPVSLLAASIAVLPVRTFMNQPTTIGGLMAMGSVLACAAFIHHEHGKRLGREMASLLGLDAEKYAGLLKAIITGVRQGEIAPTRHAPNVVEARTRGGLCKAEFIFRTRPHL